MARKGPLEWSPRPDPVEEVMAHTPGPWYEAGTGTHQGLIISERDGKDIAVSYDKRDAALIAAAPELLEGLMNAIEVVETYANEFEKRSELGRNQWYRDALVAIQKALRK